jgi:hypothetical protein
MAWRGDGFARYFAPAFVLVPVVLAGLLPPRRAVLALVVACAAPALVSYRAVLADRQLALCHRVGGIDFRPAARSAEEAPKPPCVPVTGGDSGLSFYSAKAPFACCWAQFTPWEPLRSQLCR